MTDVNDKTHVYTSPRPPSSAGTRKRTPTAPLLPILRGPHPVHCVCTSCTRLPTPSSFPYTSNAMPTLTTLAMSVYRSPLGANLCISERISSSLLWITAFEMPATATSEQRVRNLENPELNNSHPRWRGNNSWKPTATISGARGECVRNEDTCKVGYNQSTRSRCKPRSPCRFVLYEAICTSNLSPDITKGARRDERTSEPAVPA